MLLFGLGGELVEVFKDRALGLPPLTTTLARRMMERTRVYTALKGVRGRCRHRHGGPGAAPGPLQRARRGAAAIAELDINPLLASPERLLALDARVILHPGEVAEPDLPRPAIRPYPRRYARSWRSADGLELLIRPIRPEDESARHRLPRPPLEETVYQRYFAKLGYEQRIAHERLVRICFTDYDREIALVAERFDAEQGKLLIASVGRIIRLRGSDAAELSLIVADDHQGMGLGTEMVRRLIEVARAEGVDLLTAEVLSANSGMLRIFAELGFGIEGIEEGGDTLRVELPLAG